MVFRLVMKLHFSSTCCDSPTLSLGGMPRHPMRMEGRLREGMVVWACGGGSAGALTGPEGLGDFRAIVAGIYDISG